MDDVARPTSYRRSDEVIALSADAVAEMNSASPPTAYEPEIPDYLQDTYYWCYINPRNVRLLDREFVVRTILWQQHKKLQQLAFAEIGTGQTVLQPASVYGSFAPNLAKHIGPTGSLDVVDVARVQVNSVGKKLEPYPNARVYHANIVHFNKGPYDVACCYFLLHEVPENYKHKIVNLLLEKVEVGGKVVFVDYHKPRWWHPLKLITSIVFDTLEPFAKTLWHNEIRSYAVNANRYEWRKETIFAGLFQKVVATRLD